jgi:glutamate-1-semialdehyde 2,1-aminomutase
MKIYNYNKSLSLFKRAVKVLPNGIPGHFTPAVLIPPSSYPFYLSKSKDSHFWDVDGNEFIDYMCAYGPMVVGYNNKIVESAAAKQRISGDCVSLAAPAMVELAELLVDMVPVAKWAFFCKNGGDVTNLSIMSARAATNRKKIVMIDGGYHGVSSWMQSAGHKGIVDEDIANIIRIPWNDTAAFERAIAENPKQIAGFIATPTHVPTFADSVLPADGYWKKIEEICKKEGIVFIIDDIRHGFRHSMKGTNEYFGFKPDLICYCKALANGYPISALVGTDAMKNAVAGVFYTGSYWYGAVHMAAAIANLTYMQKINAPEKMLSLGKKLCDGLVSISRDYGYELVVSGTYSMPTLRIANDPSLMLHQDWCAECTRRGAYFVSHHNWFLSTAHTDADIKKTLQIADEAFKAVKKKYGDEF